jgi:putative DNA primase/helicase
MEYSLFDSLPTSLREAAAAYAAAGWPVFPTDFNKRPLVEHGFKDATTDPEMIRRLWQNTNAKGIGIPTGSAIGAFVVDIDPGHGGAETLAALEAKYGALPATLTSFTGGGGLHYFFRYVEGIRNSAGHVGAGIDIRGEGGYIVAPPSGHQSGQNYQWTSTRSPAEAPTWLLEAIFAPKPKPGSPKERQSNGNGDGTPYGKAALDAELRRVQAAREGTRNATLNEAAFSIGQLVAGGELPASALDYLSTAGESAGLPAAEVRATLESGFSAGSRSPRQAPPPAKPPAKPAKLPAEEGAEDHLSLPDTLTDSGNADLIVERFGAGIRYLHESADFLVWNGKQWEPGADFAVKAFAQSIARDFYRKAFETQDPEKARQYSKHAHKSLSAPAIRNAVELVQIYPAIRATARQFDRRKDRVNVNNGIVDLRSGALLHHDPAEYHRHLIGIDYDPDATCPLWRRTLDQIFLDRSELVEYVQRYAGYSLTGETNDQSLMILHGRGSNGKSLLLRVLAYILGTYAKTTRAETLMEKPSGNDGANPDIADLWGARFVSAAETRPGARLDDALVKRATGQDVMKARFLFRNFFEFEPEFKLWLSANHKPRIDGADEAMVRRLRLIPFEAKFTAKPSGPNEFPIDDCLADRLREERAGILRWLVEGSMAYYQKGLEAPEIVQAATANYAAEMDQFSAFLAERCLSGVEHKARAGDLLAAYREFCEEGGERPKQGSAWNALLDRAGLKRERGHAGARWIRGVSLLAKDAAFD